MSYEYGQISGNRLTSFKYVSGTLRAVALPAMAHFVLLLCRLGAFAPGVGESFTTGCLLGGGS
jgi:hypothetical protein